MYNIFDTYVLRTPLLTIDFFLNLTKEDKVTDEQLKDIFSDPTIKEAIFLASPAFYKEVEKWSTGKKIDEKGEIQNSLLKYLSRISSRPTPFGLFSGCSTGQFMKENKIKRENSLNKRHTRLDMNLTGALIKSLKEIPSIKEQLNFFPNNSLFELGDLLRFIESKYNDNSVLVQKMIEVESSDYIKEIIQFCGEGKSISQISNLLVDNDIEFDNAREFIMELIDSQILVSELEQTVSGVENFDNILSVLNRIEYKSPLTDNLKSIKLKLAELDKGNSNGIDAYIQILDLLKEFNITFNEKYVFQTDLIIGHNHNTLDEDIAENIQEGLALINTISDTNSNKDLYDFKKAFYDRYETKEISLALALDKEIGLGYPINSGSGDPNPLIDDITFNNYGSVEANPKLSQIDILLFDKIVEAEKKGSKIIEIREDEIKTPDCNWLNLPDTFSTIAQIAVIENQNMIHLNSFFGASAGNLFGRFCHGDSQINKFVEKIMAIENNLNPNIILAEIVHLPEDRIGNVLMRPSFRNYEIPFLSRSTKPSEKQIPINDIFISIKNNRLFLRSKKLNKEICPRLTTAHNYSHSNLPIYRFLCDMQLMEKRKTLHFQWNTMISNYLTFFPRVIYKNIILFTSKWKITTDKVKNILVITDDDVLLEAKFKEFVTKYNIPKLVYLIEGDNKLLINTSNLSSIKMLLSLIKNKSLFILEEFIFSDNTICVDSKQKGFVNEFIFSFYKN
ncbi:lantibiotic dehydratase family protein [Flavobacterium daemonense]|uniref:lantibiotic dehydratase family protein n=1 Tax=Flavobacterium daemonense TaxID=1393049 RepID=UPI001186B6AE|nr:lantibiotic dehydratase family protein [Flavobacterium daemonense]KAF2329083.1 hypothetical protein FND99_17290 [Flavobacterium daemonense]